MPRRTRVHLDGVPLHIVQRGHNCEPCFFSEDDYDTYLYWLGKALGETGCALHAYVLLPSWLRGISVHSEFSRLVDTLGFDFTSEQSYRLGQPTRYGLLGSVRADAVYGDIVQPSFAYELKTGGAYATRGEARAYQDHLPPGTRLVEHRVP